MEHIADILGDIGCALLVFGLGAMSLGIGLMILSDGCDEFVNERRRNKK